MDIQRRKDAVARLSVASNTVLVVLKLTVGLLIGSVSVVSETIHSGVDLLAAIIALLADAWHLRTDVYASAGVMLGLLVMRRLSPALCNLRSRFAV
jgi:divalent metal cation (Fe/Co/Zn/Cd) transporter